MKIRADSQDSATLKAGGNQVDNFVLVIDVECRYCHRPMTLPHVQCDRKLKADEDR